MSELVFVENLSQELSECEISTKEVLRYMANAGEDDNSGALINECKDLCRSLSKAKACYRIYDIKFDPNDTNLIDLGFCRVNSKNLSKNLYGCKRIVLFAATVGIEFDRMISKYSRVLPSRSLCINAIGSERVERLCDLFCDMLCQKYGKLRRRFSVGYGDLPLSLQSDIFAALECPKHIGVTINESNFMTPIKSVTAIVGIEELDSYERY